VSFARIAAEIEFRCLLQRFGEPGAVTGRQAVRTKLFLQRLANAESTDVDQDRFVA
jgi:hypothetical protein